MKRYAGIVTLGLAAAGCSGGGGSSTAGTIPNPGPSMVTLQQVQNGVFTPSCSRVGCHVGMTAPFGLDLSEGQSFGNTVGVASAEVPAFQRVEPFVPNDSYMYMKVTGDPRILGDPMPPLPPPIDPQQIDLVRDWIEQGANP